MESPELAEIHLARQPIVDTDLETVGYELLYRHRFNDDTAEFDNPNRASAIVLINALAERGLDSLVGKLRAFINIPGPLLSGPYLLGLDARRVVLEILEDVECTEATREAMAALRKHGYMLAMDDCPVDRITSPCTQLAHYLKLDVQHDSLEEIAAAAPIARKAGMKVLAEKVEDWETFEYLRDAGVQLFQGFFIARPENLNQQMVQANKALLLSLLVTLEDPNANLDQVVEQVNRDLALAYRLLRLINSAAIGLRRKVESLTDAVRMLGFNTVKTLAYLSALSGIDGKPPALITTALTRARFCELLARATGREAPNSYFLVGLFSMLDAFYNQPLEEIIHELPLSEPVVQAILAHEGDMGEVLEFVMFYERGEFLEGDEQTEALASAATEAYPQAIAWVEEVH
ncbi:MAG: EAL and HDOD domain-containing protein [Halothiobacillaceae bacterium]